MRTLRPSLWFLIALVPTVGATGALASQGSIHPLAVEIDDSANVHFTGSSCVSSFSNGGVKNLGATADWVKDCLANNDPTSLVNSVATGIKTDPPDQTGAARSGHWQGVRIVDGLAGSDENIFLTGGKENDVSSWNIGPGSVGSSKYDITQAYLASNRTHLFFGMERRGNNGTTAFDFEFNQLAPNAATPLVPTRSLDDVLYTFEMSGSGGSGSATPHVFKWNGSKYVEEVPAPLGLITSINNADTPAAPWGYVDSKGKWVTGNLPRFQFAEAAVPLSTLPGVNACGGSAFVQVRTRSSSTDNSDLKDTTKIFEFVFGGPAAVLSLGPGCSRFSYDGTASRDSGSGTDLLYGWDFTVPDGVVLSNGGVSADSIVANLYHSSQASGTVDVTMPQGQNTATIHGQLNVAEIDNSCSDSAGSEPVIAYRQLPATASKTAADGAALTATLAGGGPGATSIQWQRFDGASWLNVGGPIGADSGSLVYSSFELDALPAGIGFQFGPDSYLGKQWSVDLRLHAERAVSLNGGGSLTCTADSPAVTVRKVTGVDP